MKVSEAIEKLTVKRDDVLHFQKLYKPGDVGWSANESKAIAFNIAINTLEQIDEPQAEKVGARLAEHWHEDIGPVLWWNFPVEEPPYCGTPLDERFPKYKTHFTTIDMPTEIEQPKRWVVRAGDYHSTYVDSLTITSEKTRYTISGKEKAHYFTDKSKAEAVATLVEGTVEEV